MKKQLFFLLIINLLSITVFSQKECTKDYYSTDSSMVNGITIISGNDFTNSRYCQVIKGGNLIQLSPNEITEYGFKNGRVYKSFDVVVDNITKRYFLERLTKDKIGLYYFKPERGIRKIYLSSGDSSSLSEVLRKKDELYLFFSKYTSGCPEVLNNIKFIRYKKFDLQRFVEDINNNKKRVFPRTHFGFKLGLNATRFYAVDKADLYGIPEYDVLKNFTFGTFVDIPIKKSSFSFVPELYYQHISFIKTFSDGVDKFDLYNNISSINIPVLFRYTFLRPMFSPYFQAGPVYSMIIKNDSWLKEYLHEGPDFFIRESPVIQKKMTGISIGGGFILNYDSKFSGFAEVRLNNNNNFFNKTRNLNFNEISVSTGFLF